MDGALRKQDTQSLLINSLDSLQAKFASVEPAIHAFVPEPGRFERLRSEAESLGARYPSPGARPSLFGVMVGVKDIFRVDGLLTRAGSRLPPELFEGPEASSVTMLKEAGALIAGKTVTTEFAYFGPGPTRNPRNPEHTPGGSSSGSAAAVAAGLCDLALGTQTIGSIIRPAAFCGVVGYKPSHERVSRDGVIPLSPSLDHVGLFARSVAEVRAAARLLCSDWSSETGEPGKPVLGVPEGPYLDRASEVGLVHFRATVERLKGAGYEVRSVSAMANYDEIHARHNLIVAVEAAGVHGEWFARYAELYHPKTADLIRRGQAASASDLAEVIAGRERLRAELTTLMDLSAIDVWICPSAPGGAPKGLDATGDPVMNLPWTHAGMPAVNLPSGRTAEGLPLGLQVVAGFGEDERLLSWARGIESALGNWG